MASAAKARDSLHRTIGGCSEGHFSLTLSLSLSSRAPFDRSARGSFCIQASRVRALRQTVASRRTTSWTFARELKALHQLRKDTVLTAEEFQFKKDELLTNYFHHGRERKA